MAEEKRQLVRSHEQAFAADVDGLLAMLLSQASDPMLCLRELTANSVDAGARGIYVEVRRKRNGQLWISHEDDGAGMDLEKLGRYLRLFDSTKEQSPYKVGEMGVGKILALALKPQYLVVETGDGKKGYKVVIENGLNGQILETKRRTGTKVTIVLEKPDSTFEDKVREALHNSCCHIEAPLYLNRRRINKPIDLNTDLKLYCSDGLGQVVVGLTGKYGCRLLKGGILLEESYRLEVDGIHPFEGLELIVNSYEFKKVLSANAVLRDEGFKMVMKRAVAAAEELAGRLAERYLDKNFRNDAQAIAVSAYLRQLLGKRPFKLPALAYELPLFNTVDGDQVSYNQITKAANANGMAVYYNTNPMAAGDISWFKNRGIPVLLQTEPDISSWFGQGGYVPVCVGKGLVIEGLHDDERRCGLSADEACFIRGMNGLLGDIDARTERQSMEGSHGYSHVVSVHGLPGFDWGKIGGIDMYRITNLRGEPQQDPTAYWHAERSTIVLNRNSPYIQTMLDLAKTNPGLSRFYTLCAIASSKWVFPEASSRDVESFIVQLGKRVVRYGL